MSLCHTTWALWATTGCMNVATNHGTILFNSIQFTSIQWLLTSLYTKWISPDGKREMQDVLCNTSYTSTVQQKKLFTDGPWTGPGHLCPTSDPLQTNKCVPYMMSYAMRTLHIIGYVTMHTPAAAPRNYTRHKQPFSMVPLKSPIAMVTVNSIRGVGLVVPHKTIQRRTYTEL